MVRLVNSPRNGIKNVKNLAMFDENPKNYKSFCASTKNNLYNLGLSILVIFEFFKDLRMHLFYMKIFSVAVVVCCPQLRKLTLLN